MNDIAVKCKNIWPGLGIATITGMAALFLSEHYNAPAMLFALLLGMAVSFLYQEDAPCACGIDFTASTLTSLSLLIKAGRAEKKTHLQLLPLVMVHLYLKRV